MWFQMFKKKRQYPARLAKGEYFENHDYGLEIAGSLAAFAGILIFMVVIL